jgi:hypothetical protein
MAKQYKCVKGWARNNVGDIVEEYMINRYPKEIKMNNFVEYVESKKANKKSTTKSSPKPTTSSLSKSSISSSDKS